MLEILGIIFLVLIGLVVAFFTWLFFKARKGMQEHARVAAIAESMSVPAIVLEPTENLSLAQPEAVAELVKQAADLGAISCGNYDVPVAAARLCAFSLETPPVYIVIYDHDQVDPWIDVVMRCNDDRSLTVSTVAAIARGAPRHPDDQITHSAPGTALGVLVREAAERAQSEATLPATPGAFKEYFEAAAEKSRKYTQSSAVNQEWLESIAEDSGVELSGDEAAQINHMREEQQVTQTENDCFTSLAESGNFSVTQWDEIRDNLVAVWDEMPGEYAAAVLYNHVDIPQELESAVDALEERHGHARERIAQLNSNLPEDKQLILVGSVSSPVKADIYRYQNPCV